ncbi:uncharacterized protein LOC129762220 [Toxorhynchites rutilus septentrionalis]|uniref:uncharacterized protein LOC129762220 n=1 Tax=Toxorhynchites rutilus septentrionalis TaxID=329112 RepID=UPI00247A476D|nr:uncharacterized protein LOC129762220 [Toxorhynchites rutilus septentrionalis]
MTHNIGLLRFNFTRRGASREQFPLTEEGPASRHPCTVFCFGDCFRSGSNCVVKTISLCLCSEDLSCGVSAFVIIRGFGVATVVRTSGKEEAAEKPPTAIQEVGSVGLATLTGSFHCPLRVPLFVPVSSATFFLPVTRDFGAISTHQSSAAQEV